MKIESVTLVNFRCFGPDPTSVLLDHGISALVGNNGSGKTALLAALTRLFGVSDAQRSVLRRDFHLTRTEGELTSGKTLSIDVVLAFPELAEGNDADNLDAVPEFFLHMSASGPGQPLKARMRLQAIWTDDGTPGGNIDGDVRWIQTLGEGYEWEKCKKVAPIERSSIQLIYVPATRNAAEQVSNLLKGRLWRAARWSASLAGDVETGAGAIQEKFEAEEPAKFIASRLERRWQQVYEADTDTKPLLRLVDSRLEDLVRHAQFAFVPDEEGRVRDVADLSDGQRSLFHIALTAATLEIERDVLALRADESPFDQDRLRRIYLTILAIEEPENSLSPFFLSRIIGQAREISGLPTAQVLVSSHSASILSRIEPEEVRYFRLDRETRTAFVRGLTLPVDDVEARKYVRLAAKAYPELYFARFVILGEGDSERIVVPRIAEALGLHLDQSFVPIVPLGGRYVSHFWKLLNDLSIPHASLLDLDLGRQHGGAGAVRTAISALNEIGNDLSGNASVVLGSIDLDDLDELTNDEMIDGFETNAWLQALAAEGVFFSDPIDLDFSMLEAFPEAYRHPNPGGRGPRTTPESIAEKKRVTLKTGGIPALYDESYDEVFSWYPYLFLDHSKPERHLSALGRIDLEDLAEHAPPELKALIAHLKKALGFESEANAA